MNFSVFNASWRSKTSTIGLILSDVLFFILSDPAKLAVPFMIFGFLLIGANVYLICRFAGRILAELGLIKSSRRWAVALVSLFINVMIILQSMGQLSLRDIIALIPLVLVTYFYFTRVSSRPSAWITVVERRLYNSGHGTTAEPAFYELAACQRAD